MNLKEYADKYIWKNIDVDGQYWSQCVDQVKHYAKEVLWVSLGSFWWSAKNGWLNTVNTFPSTEWEKIVKGNNVPQVWDIIFWTTWPYEKYGHVWVVYDVMNGKFMAINQNSWNGDGQGKDDAIRLQDYTYNNIAGWYRYKKERSYRDIAWETVIEDIEKVAKTFSLSKETADELVALIQIIAQRTK